MRGRSCDLGKEMKFCVSQTGIRKLAENLFHSNSTKALKEAHELVMKYKNGAGAIEVMQHIKEAKKRMGIQPQQSRLDGI